MQFSLLHDCIRATSSYLRVISTEWCVGGVESMFAKELARRQQMGKDSAAESSKNKSAEAPAAATAPPPMANEASETPQLDRSRQLNSEGLEGLIPRAKILIQLGGTFFLGFLPFIAIVAGLFGALYFVRPNLPSMQRLAVFESLQ